jgi:hypothetical protein
MYCLVLLKRACCFCNLDDLQVTRLYRISPRLKVQKSGPRRREALSLTYAAARPSNSSNNFKAATSSLRLQRRQQQQQQQQQQQRQQRPILNLRRRGKFAMIGKVLN